MPIATITFNLPEEHSEYRDCMNASKMYCILWDIDQHCRDILKYGHQYKSVEDLAEYIRSEIPYVLFEEE